MQSLLHVNFDCLLDSMIAIHQSQFLPWLPFIYKIFKSDIFVILDNVQFQKNGVQNRNMIKTSQGPKWITVPVKVHLGNLINEVEISNFSAYPRILKTLEFNYKKSKFFNDIYPWIEGIFMKKIINLNDLNIELLSGILNKLDCKTKIFFSSQLGLTKTKDDLVLEIIKKFREREYLSGKGALDYMDLDKFSAEGINVNFSQFDYTAYAQQWDATVPFVPELSVIDLLFNNLQGASAYITANGRIEKIIEGG